jgi:hypothetical protein
MIRVIAFLALLLPGLLTGLAMSSSTGWITNTGWIS